MVDLASAKSEQADALSSVAEVEDDDVRHRFAGVGGLGGRPRPFDLPLTGNVVGVTAGGVGIDLECSSGDGGFTTNSSSATVAAAAASPLRGLPRPRDFETSFFSAFSTLSGLTTLFLVFCGNRCIIKHYSNTSAS